MLATPFKYSVLLSVLVFAVALLAGSTDVALLSGMAAAGLAFLWAGYSVTGWVIRETTGAYTRRCTHCGRWSVANQFKQDDVCPYRGTSVEHR